MSKKAAEHHRKASQHHTSLAFDRVPIDLAPREHGRRDRSSALTPLANEMNFISRSGTTDRNANVTAALAEEHNAE